VGSIAIDGEELGNNIAHLRWFIMDEQYKGQGIGRQLLHDAVIFCEKSGFNAIQLWTFKGLYAA
jgi:GNAT superfamily N-acetyltransferase